MTDIRAPERLSNTALRQMISLVPKVTGGLALARRRVLWRNLLARFPAEPVLAGEYVLALLRSESWDDLAAFEPEARRHGQNTIDLFYVDAALARGDSAGAAERLAAVERRDGTSRETLWRRHDQYFMQHDFDRAIETAEQLAGQTPADRRRAGRLARKAAFYRDLHSKWAAAVPRERDYDIYVVNLDSDTLRMERMNRQLDGVPFTRVPGVRGAYLPDMVLEAVTHGIGAAAKGTVGCFLSHLGTWERVVRAGRPALVLEDDAWVLAGLPSRLADVHLPKDFDYVSAAETFLPHEFDYRRKSFGVARPRDVLPGKPSNWETPSTVAYFISPAGARKLLARVERDGAAGDVDWRILAYSLSSRERQAELKRDTAASRLLGHHHRLVAPGRRPINAYVLVPGLTRYFVAGSVRLHDNIGGVAG
ncbi:MAG: glycosyltransferase family 25 protein [Hyphomicrobiales bacterium]|nr:MAG: glycosyltransferase family 25 protein [Hyphomicrobiales bacterium]